MPNDLLIIFHSQRSKCCGPNQIKVPTQPMIISLDKQKNIQKFFSNNKLICIV